MWTVCFCSYVHIYDVNVKSVALLHMNAYFFINDLPTPTHLVILSM